MTRCVAVSMLIAIFASCASGGETNRATVNDDGMADIETDTLSWEDLGPNERNTFCEGYNAVSPELFRQSVADEFVTSDVEAIFNLFKENC